MVEVKQVAGTVQQAGLGLENLGAAEPGPTDPGPLEPGHTQTQRAWKELAREPLTQQSKAVQPSFPPQAQAE